MWAILQFLCTCNIVHMTQNEDIVLDHVMYMYIGQGKNISFDI